jgi:acetylglutamate/LysW-gamma-L-alpha-aminoadipate kinase
MLVVKVGGSEGIDYDALCDDIAGIWKQLPGLVLVHGGSDETNHVAEALGHPPRFVTSPSGHTSRYTDRRTLEIFEMVYCGSMNKGLVERLQTRGINAFGLSGLDGRLVSGKRKDAIRVVEEGRQRILRDDWTGSVTHVDVRLLRMLIHHDYLPVVAPLICGEKGEALNADGDRVAAAIAVALKAESLLLLSNVPGLLRNFPDESSIIEHIPRAEVDSYMQYAQGRMKKKVQGAAEAVDHGVPRVVLGDARGEKSISRALSGHGCTVIH